ncbi:ADP-ribosylation factor GTPase activating protein, ER-Golgi transport [Entomortierella beljakovae]|nr:ADP-ribosylation factor GTPase activating protein, ER-Golgi transport [Entomortierella beljakovae]
MTLGGNAAAREYFSKQPGVDSKDAKTKYSSKIGTTYKEKLAQKVKDDMIAHPGKLTLDHHSEDANKSTTSTPMIPSAEDDFFNTWDQPKKSTPSASPLTSGPPIVGFGSAASSSASRTSTTAATRPVKSTLTSARKTGTATKPMKLGVKRVGANFEEAEARAKAEAERIEKLGFEAAEEERLQKLEAQRLREEAANRSSFGGGGSGSESSNVPSNYYSANTADKTSRVSSEDMERLGMGMGRMGFGAAPSKTAAASTRSGFGSSSYSPQVEENTTSAREKFGNQKAISSDQYFGRGNYDSDAQAEASSRLQSFTGATSISSNQYFGRPDEPTTGSDRQADLTTIKNAVQVGAGKLTDMLQDMQAKYNYY